MTKNNNQNRKNKDNTFISTYQTHQKKITSKEIEVLDDVCQLFQLQKRKWFSNKEKNRVNFIQSQKIIIKGKNELPFTYRFFQGIKQEVQGMTRSIDSNRENYLIDLNNKLKDQQKKIKKKSLKYKNTKANLQALRKSDDELKTSLFYLRGSYHRLYCIENSINKILENTKNSHYPICFGSKKLLKKRHLCKTPQEINEWNNEWHEKRHNSFMLVGSHDENQGCSIGQLSYDIEKDKFDFKLSIPNILKEKHGKELVLKDVDIPKYCRKQVLFEVLKHQENDKKKEALSFRFIKSKQGYRLNISLNQTKQNIVTSSKHGVVGLDINPDNLAVTEIDQHGNFLNSFVINMDLKGKSSEQSIAIIGESVKKLMKYCEASNKHLVVENLDFKKKRNELHKSKNPKYARMLSSFAYQKILSLIEIQGYKKGINVVKVNPAYTSLLGKTHYAVDHGLSNHQAAAFVIARRFFKFKESIKKLLKIVKKSEVFTLRVPEGKQRSIRAFSTWLSGVSFERSNTLLAGYIPHNRLFNEGEIETANNSDGSMSCQNAQAFIVG